MKDKDIIEKIRSIVNIGQNWGWEKAERELNQWKRDLNSIVLSRLRTSENPIDIPKTELP